MEISAANLTALFTGFDVVFQRGFEKPPSYYEQITSVVRSASRQTTYPWLGRTTKFREWLGDRVIQALETHEYTIVNRNFEDTVAIDRNDIEDDTTARTSRSSSSSDGTPRCIRTCCCSRWSKTRWRTRATSSASTECRSFQRAIRSA